MINLTERDNARGWYPSFRRMFPASIKNNKLRRREVSLPLIMIDSDWSWKFELWEQICNLMGYIGIHFGNRFWHWKKREQTFFIDAMRLACKVGLNVWSIIIRMLNNDNSNVLTFAIRLSLCTFLFYSKSRFVSSPLQPAQTFRKAIVLCNKISGPKFLNFKIK